MEKKFKIVYLPISLSDLRDIVDYIALELKSPQAAANFIKKFDESVSKLENFPYSGFSYKGTKHLEYDYRVIIVENYLVFYTILDEIVEIHRVIYAKRKLDELM